MKKNTVSIAAGILALLFLALGIHSLLSDQNAGSEYETLLTADGETAVAKQDMGKQETEKQDTTEYVMQDGTETAKTDETQPLENETLYVRNDIDFAALQERNPDVYAWIEVPGTLVDYPILQHPEDNSYYLNYTIDHKKATAAAIYTEDYNSRDFNDHHTVIYGHNMKNDSMFGSLHSYHDSGFFEENRDIIIYMPKETRVYKIFAAYTYDNRHLLHNFYCEESGSFQSYLDEIFSIKDFDAHIDHDMEVTGDDYVITLSTCVESGNSAQRYLVQAVLVSVYVNEG